MNINDQSLRGLYTGFNLAFQKGFTAAPSYYRTISMTVPSATAQTTYAWLGAMPAIREWLGDRILHSLSVSSYAIENRRFELAVRVPRTAIEDDQYGIFGPVMEKMGRDTARHPDELIFGLLAAGFTTPCYDGQYFFDAEHPIGRDGNGNVVDASNVQTGTGAPWFLIDAGQPIKPLIYQERLPFQFQSLTNTDEHVFFNDEYVYGVRGRSNAGFGLWQLAYASKAELTADNYALARAAMMSQKGDNGKTLGITPTHLIVPPSLEAMARGILRALDTGGGTNPWAGSAELITSHYLA